MRILSCLCILFLSGNFLPGEDFERQRIRMVKTQIESQGVGDKVTLAALSQVPRHHFVPPEMVKYAYADRPLPIGYGQTISQPYIVAYMTEQLRLKPNFRVLEIGTGSGYQAAVLAQIVEKVYTIEIVSELADQARERLKGPAYDNVSVKHADGFFGWEEAAPFDAIIVTAASEFIPPPLINQLKDGGRMIIPVGSPFGLQRLIVITKNGDKVKTRRLIPVRFVPFTRRKR